MTNVCAVAYRHSVALPLSPACPQVVLAHASEFLQANASSLNLDSTSPKYAFKWLQLADAACLADACKACADRIIQLIRTGCTTGTLEALSPQTLIYMVKKAMSATATVSKSCKLLPYQGLQRHSDTRVHLLQAFFLNILQFSQM
jgi:hypothetical protein